MYDKWYAYYGFRDEASSFIDIFVETGICVDVIDY